MKNKASLAALSGLGRRKPMPRPTRAFSDKRRKVLDRLFDKVRKAGFYD
jgi:hypothetical protein